MSTSFGYDIPAGDIHHDYITSADQILAAVSELCHPAGTLMNAIPLLRHIPPWFPGASAQKYAANVRKVAMAYRNKPFEYARSRFVNCSLLHMLTKKLKIVRS